MRDRTKHIFSLSMLLLSISVFACGAGPGPREIWGGLDTVAGSSRPRFALAHSADGGETFELVVFRKPCRLATFFDFAMDREGHGRATLSLDSDCGKYKAGLYHYET